MCSRSSAARRRYLPSNPRAVLLSDQQMHTQPVTADVLTAPAAAAVEARSGQCPGMWHWVPERWLVLSSHP